MPFYAHPAAQISPGDIFAEDAVCSLSCAHEGCSETLGTIQKSGEALPIFGRFTPYRETFCLTRNLPRNKERKF